MKTIKKGKLKIKEEFKPITATCEHCGSIIEFEPNEIMTYSYRDILGVGNFVVKKNGLFALRVVII